MSDVAQSYIFPLQDLKVCSVDSAGVSADTFSIAHPNAPLANAPIKKDWTYSSLNADSVLCQQLTLEVPDSLSLSTERPYGFSGKTLPFNLEHSVAVQSILLACLLLTTFAFSRGYRLYIQLIKDLFKQSGRVGFFLENSAVGFELKASLSIQALLLESLISYNLVRELLFSDYIRPSYLHVIVYFLISFLIYQLFRFLFVTFLGSLFSDASSLRAYSSAHFSFLSIWGALLFPLALLMIFVPISAYTMAHILFLPLILGKFFLITKGIKIFFTQKRGLFYIILYLCALEILPLIALVQTLVYFYYKFQ